MTMNGTVAAAGTQWAAAVPADGVRTAAEGVQGGSAFVTVLLLGALFGTGVLVRRLRDRGRSRRRGE